MALGRDYDKACPIFNFSTRDAGVMFPFVITDIDNATTPLPYINFDGASQVNILARFKLPFRARVITCQAIACSDNAAVKGGACTTTEPIISIGYGTPVLASGSLATNLALITCDGAGPFGTVWTPSAGTTQTTLEEGQEIIAYLSQVAAHSAASANIDGGARVIVWLSQVNAPA